MQDGQQQTVSPRGRELLAWINQHGPSTVRRLVDKGHLNYYTYKPDLDQLVSKGLLRRDEKSRAKPGNPVYYHMTPKGAQVITGDWNTITVLERSIATSPDNYSDLGIVNDLLSVAVQSVEPSGIKSALWLILLLGGLTLVGMGKLIGIAPLAIDMVLFYDDYVRRRPGLGRPGLGRPMAVTFGRPGQRSA